MCNIGHGLLAMSTKPTQAHRLHPCPAFAAGLWYLEDDWFLFFHFPKKKWTQRKDFLFKSLIYILQKTIILLAQLFTKNEQLMSTSHSTILAEALQEKWSSEKVAEKLAADGHDEISVNLLLREYKKLQNAKRQTTGFLLAGLGAFLGLVSCMLTVFNPFPEMFHVILYGLTSLAICIAFIGLYYIFE